ncbi:uncharacterized protein LOC143446040 [Clavelina lepadiformis]|uniref:uncharacterized protein LOC143446040 n=1 Tax=Clavelina lepadiformis TaxID=159417 RepID=UPI0040433B36
MRRLNLTNGSTIRVVVLGGSNVGKSALVVRFLTRRFIGEYLSGIEMTYQHEVNLAGNWVTAEICDALINKEEKNYFKDIYNNTEAFLLVYNVCNHDSFDYACSLAQEIKAYHGKPNSGSDIPLLLVGNKSDLDHFREVKQTEGEAFAKSMPLCHFIETSAAESYSDVERAFGLIFALVRSRIQTSPTPSVSSTRSGRKHSFSQVAHMIRDHLRSQHSVNNNARFNSLEREVLLPRSHSLCYDKNNNSTTCPEQPPSQRTRKSAVTAMQPNFSASVFNGKPKLTSRCLSLTTLNENPNAQNTKFRENSFHDNSVRNSNQGLHKNTKCHTIDSSMSAQYMNTMAWQAKEERGNAVNMSISSDDTMELSDLSTPEEDAVFSDQNEKSPPSHSRIMNQNKKEKTRKSSVVYNGLHNDNDTRKTLNKKGLSLSVTIHSDGEYDERKSSESDNLPPKSAPILASASGNKFRYFPNGAVESTDCQRPTWLAVRGNKNVPISPLLEGAPRLRQKSPKEEKRTPSNNLLKQFFKGALYGSSGRGSSQSLTSIGSEASLSSVLTAAEFSCSLTSIHENPEDNLENYPIYFRASSSSSLSSIISNDGDVSSLQNANTSASAPASPRVKKSNLEPKPRRPTFREAVTELIRKRKKSTVTNEYVKNSKERFL